MKKSLCFVLVSVIMLTTACESLEQIVKNNIAKPTVSYQSFSIGVDDDKNIVLKPVFQVTNNNSYAVPVDNFSYQLSFNGAKMLDGASSQIGTLPAMGAKPVELEIPLNSEVLSSFKQLLFNNKKLEYSVQGTVQVLGFKVPFEKTDTLQRPTFSFGSMAVNSASFSEIHLGLALQIDNPNQFSIPLENISYSVKTGNKFLFSGEIADMKIEKDINKIDIPITLHPNQVFSNVFSLLKNPELPLVIDIDSGLFKETFNYNLNLKSIL